MDMFVSQVGSVHSIPFPGSLALLTFGDPLNHLTIRQNFVGKYQPDGETYPF